jgi:hypothetical protein
MKKSVFWRMFKYSVFLTGAISLYASFDDIFNGIADFLEGSLEHLKKMEEAKKSGLLPPVPEAEKAHLPPQIVQEIIKIIENLLRKKDFPQEMIDFFIQKTSENIVQVFIIRFTSFLTETDIENFKKFQNTNPTTSQLWAKMEQLYKNNTGDNFNEMIKQIMEFYLESTGRKLSPNYKEAVAYLQKLDKLFLIYDKKEIEKPYRLIEMLEKDAKLK